MHTCDLRSVTLSTFKIFDMYVGIPIRVLICPEVVLRRPAVFFFAHVSFADVNVSLGRARGGSHTGHLNLHPHKYV